MGVVVVTPASDNLLSTVGSIKTELKKTDTSDDAFLSTLLQQVSDQIATYCQRVFAQEVVKETIGAVGLTEILLSRTPIDTSQSITVTFDGDAVTDFSVLDEKAGILYRKAGWTNTAFSWPTITTHPSPYVDPLWEFTYTGGWKLPSAGSSRNLPYDIERVAIDLVKHYFRQRKRDPTVSRYRIRDTDVSWQKTQAEPGEATIPAGIRAVLDFYKRSF